MAATAVIVNEFGEIGLDHLLVESATEDVVLMSSGCLCCTVRGDIANTLTDLFVGRVKGKVPYFTRAVIETTGLADPAPVLHALLADPIVAERYMIDGVVTTVDAVNGAGTLDRQIEAVKQAAVADRLIVTKTDLAEPAALAALEARLAALNPGAPRLRAVNGAIDPGALFGLGLFDPETKSVEVRRWLQDEAVAAHDDHDWPPRSSRRHRHDVNRHDERIRAFCITRERPISWNALSGWLDCAGLDARRRSAAGQGDRRDRRPAGPAGRIARGAASVPPAGVAAGLARRRPPHPHRLHHPRPAAGDDRAEPRRLRGGGRAGGGAVRPM